MLQFGKDFVETIKLEGSSSLAPLNFVCAFQPSVHGPNVTQAQGTLLKNVEESIMSVIHILMTEFPLNFEASETWTRAQESASMSMF